MTVSFLRFGAVVFTAGWLLTGCNEAAVDDKKQASTCPAASVICAALCDAQPEPVPTGCAQPVCECPDTPCISDADCGDGLRCSAGVECLPPPFCEPNQPCPAVCYGNCVPDEGECPPIEEYCSLACNGLPVPEILPGCPIPGCICPVPPSSCDSNDDCQDGETCQQICDVAFFGEEESCEPECFGTCVPDAPCVPPEVICELECAGLPVPPMGPECLVSSCDCRPRTDCRSNNDCGPGETCEVLCSAGACSPTECSSDCFGVCVPADPGCDSACPPGTHCAGVCPPCAPGGPCAANCYIECQPDWGPACPEPAYVCAVAESRVAWHPACPIPDCPPPPPIPEPLPTN